MSSEEKIENQEAFIQGKVQIIVATSAFGMGVDKKDVKLVVHYDISDSLENYVQEAGRAGRNPAIQAECYVLFNEDDLDKHFILLNQTKLSISEIQQVWRGIKELTRERMHVCCSALEIARKAGWDDSVMDIETKVKTAISALENSGYLKRGQNFPRVYADSIQVKNAAEAIECIDKSDRFHGKQKEYAVRIIKNLISARSRSRSREDEAESRVDYIADHLGIRKEEVIDSINAMRDEGILASDKEMSVFVETSALHNNTKNARLGRFLKLEGFLIDKLQDNGQRVPYKVINEEAQGNGIRYSSLSSIKLLFNFWVIKGYIAKPEGEVNNTILIEPLESVEKLRKRYEKRIQVSEFIENFFLEKAKEAAETSNINNDRCVTINFSIQELKRGYLGAQRQLDFISSVQLMEKGEDVTIKEIEEALLYLSKIDAFNIEGGFLVLYNAMEITRLIQDNKIRYKMEDYQQLKEFYNSKTQQIHIVGEYANMMVRDYQAALAFVNDYFQMEYKLFLTKYFKGMRAGEIERNITPMKYQRLFENLSEKQSEIISDDVSKVIVVAAGPGSGKTKILVHKLASLMLLEDVKHEQLLMLTFSRAAAMEFKMRLVDLIGNAAYFVEIKTFHSYCFDLLGKVGNIENSQNIVHDAAQIIISGETELDRITKNVLVLDEAQDMNADEFQLIEALIERNEDMRVIAVGDDDQNIYEFRGSNSKYMAELLHMPSSKKYELTDNYRSCYRIVDFANEFVKTLSIRIKDENINAVKTEGGNVMVVNAKFSPEMSLAKVVSQTWKQENDRTAAVLTTTNDQAYLIAELLNQSGFRARLIQSDEEFALKNLAEIRYFLEHLQSQGPVICDEVWNQALEALKCEYADSNNLESCLNLFEQFKNTSIKKYYTDLEIYLQEVRFEDFYRCGKDEICVSTIHKAKGKEFDAVYMLVSGYNEQAVKVRNIKHSKCSDKLTDKQRRNIYVGITRAKSELYIFHNTMYFDDVKKCLKNGEVKWYADSMLYPEPKEIVLSLSHSDVWLGFFEQNSRSELIKKLRSGDLLQVREEQHDGFRTLMFEKEIDGKWQKVAYVSRSFYKSICAQKEKGYIPDEAWVQFVVNWQNKDSGEEYYIVLPALRMKKERSNISSTQNSDREK